MKKCLYPVVVAIGFLTISAVMLLAAVFLPRLAYAQDTRNAIAVGEEFKLSLFGVSSIGDGNASSVRPFLFENSRRSYSAWCDLHKEGTAQVAGFFKDPALPHKRATTALMRYLEPTAKLAHSRYKSVSPSGRWCVDLQSVGLVYFFTIPLEELERIKQTALNDSVVDEEIQKLLQKLQKK